MFCSNCGSTNPADAAFCEQCGRKLEVLCPACKAPVNTSARFCKKCGVDLSTALTRSEPVATKSSRQAESSVLPAQADVTDGERKTVTALFADIKGSMELMRD